MDWGGSKKRSKRGGKENKMMIKDLISSIISDNGFGVKGVSLLVDNLPEETSDNVVVLYTIMAPPAEKNGNQVAYFSIIIRKVKYQDSSDVAYALHKLFSGKSFIVAGKRLVFPRLSPPLPLGFDDYKRFKHSLNLTVYSTMD